MSWVAAAVTVGTAIYGGVSSAQASKKARKANNALLTGAENSGAFDPLAIPKPQELKVPSAQEILSSWRGEVNGNFPAYDEIAGKLNTSEQAAARYANTAANPQYYTALDSITSNALQASSGKIPDDVRQNLLRQANEDSYLRGFNYGTPGGKSAGYAGGNDAAANLALRNLGLTSLDMMKYGDTLTQGVLDQSRQSRGSIISAKDTVPTTDIFANQMNASAIAQYNFASDKANYAAASANAPIQAAYNKLALQMGVQGQNNALAAQTTTSNTQLAMSALQALGSMYGGKGTTIGSNMSSGWSGNQTYTPTSTYAQVGESVFGSPAGNVYVPSNTAQPVSSASTITAIK